MGRGWTGHEEPWAPILFQDNVIMTQIMFTDFKSTVSKLPHPLQQKTLFHPLDNPEARTFPYHMP